MLAEADRQQAILEAEAEAEAIALKGEAEAYAVEIKAKAEAEQMAKKADAWAEYKEAALVDMMLKVLPEVAREVSTPMLNTKKITMVATGEGGVGATRLTSEVMTMRIMMMMIMMTTMIRCWTSWRASPRRCTR